MTKANTPPSKPIPDHLEMAKPFLSDKDYAAKNKRLAEGWDKLKHPANKPRAGA